MERDGARERAAAAVSESRRRRSSSDDAVGIKDGLKGRSDIDIPAALVEDSQRFLNFLPASYQVDVKTVKFLQKYKALENRICSLFGQETARQLRNLCTAYNLASGSSASKIIKQIRGKFFKVYNN